MLLFRYFNISHKNVVYKRQEILFLFNFERLQLTIFIKLSFGSPKVTPQFMYSYKYLPIGTPEINGGDC